MGQPLEAVWASGFSDDADGRIETPDRDSVIMRVPELQISAVIERAVHTDP
jgi:hypothetical protein